MKNITVKYYIQGKDIFCYPLGIITVLPDYIPLSNNYLVECKGQSFEEIKEFPELIELLKSFELEKVPLFEKQLDLEKQALDLRGKGYLENCLDSRFLTGV